MFGCLAQTCPLSLLGKVSKAHLARQGEPIWLSSKARESPPCPNSNQTKLHAFFSTFLGKARQGWARELNMPLIGNSLTSLSPNVATAMIHSVV